MARTAELPAVGSRWEFPRWNNADYMGPWEVITLGVYTEEGGPMVALRRCEGRRQIEHTPCQFWPGGWEPAK